ncbi:Zn-dependent alcohol dehydrogenase [Pelagicoccus sp. SDUM812003]|uniref:Zn-dependent alcohol dehydrogenase n=1 Tax=Pelagicoccus sp. SDUM812003 TaxID=3041267 RepID=UPI00280C576B|nr:Zn-dependent alcohol dehydrogenase [Pelagicoccus sp. SDUM812003]MDQ8201457.1 Zn-dependent alcohol dehydrogenase [Pelagicoccus sp. SDUM812003]
MINAKAAVADAKGSFTIEEIEVGEPQAGEVLVKLKASGVCHTDWDSLRWGYHHVLGHEGAGIVEAVGDGVQTVKVGDAVLLNWAIPCRSCYQCQTGHQNICEQNSPVTGANPDNGMAHPEATCWKGAPLKRSFNIGTLSSHTIVKQEAVVRATVDIPFESACIIGCGVMTGYGSVVNAAQLKAGSSAVVLGLGGVGLSVIQGARISGAAKIIAVDVNEHRLEISKTFGATHLIKASRDDKGLASVAAQVKELCGGRGADYAFECTGVPALGAAPLAMVRNAGTAVQVSGIEQVIEIDMNLFEWDKTYLNPLYGGAMPEYDFPRLLDLYACGKLLLDELITRKYPLERLQDAIDDMLAGRNAKGVVVFE